VLLCAGSLVREQDLAFNPYPAGPPEVPSAELLASRPSATRLEELLYSEGGNISAVSRRLQVCSKTIYRWLKSYRIDLMNIRGAEVV
jgi:transposase-like protein